MSEPVRFSRRGLLQSGSKVAVLAATAGIAPRFIRPSRAYAATRSPPE